MAPTDAAKPAVGADGKPAVAPAEVKITLPAEFDAKDPVIAAALPAVSEFAKEAGLNEKQANAAAAKYLGAIKASEKAATEARVKQEAAELAAIQKDPELGGDKLEATTKTVASVFAKVPGGEKAREALVKAGLGSNRDVIALLNFVGKSLGEDRIAGGTGASAQKTAADKDAELLKAFFPNTKFANP